ncbi:MAG: DUF2330 domain-containing protein [Ktedonobacteraceae bacterium]|nr:DUF2330 domain-containing protein [Ktedonobacteraceae bacterium]MBO0790762.1 DUF2330 domain-containing protein [Ktedonobacteraceae bacterium]
MFKKLSVALVAALILVATQALPSFACGGLIAPDGDVHLDRATTLVAWHDGVEHYMTSFAYQGQASNIGWIVPLPAVPEKIEAGGAWTFQRMDIESHPQRKSLQFAGADTAASSAQVLQQVKVEALNVTVIRGSGQEVLNWANQNDFYVDFETRSHLLMYAQGSPIFMAAKYDTAAAIARHQLQGNGVPLLITMKTPHPWVPLEILALGNQQVQADLYFLTDQPINTSDLNAKLGQSAVNSEVPGAPGFKVAFQEPMSDRFYKDLSSDRNMKWIPRNSWFTYLTLDAPSPQVTYDLAINSAGVIRLATYGTAPNAIIEKTHDQEMPSWLPTLPMGASPWIAGSLAVVLCLGLLVFQRIRHRRKVSPSSES